MNDQRFNPPPIHNPMMGYQPAPEYPGATKNDAMTVLILGVLGIAVCQLCAPFAWARGNTYRNVCMVHGIEQESFAIVGRVLGIVGTVLLGLTLLYVLAVIGIMVAAH
jgi:uncharacterized membrane protein YjgN (DUF898 family)